MIHVVDVLQHYGIRPVLRNLTLEVREGELLVIMGPNGSGKTTLLGIMAGLLAPLEGYVEIAGMRRRASEEQELAIRRKVYYLPAEPWQPATTGRAFLGAVGELYDVPPVRLMDHAERLLQLFDLADKGDTLIQDYSSGQQKKIALASALITECPVLLLDEPFSGGLDPSGIEALRRVLKGLAQRDDITIVMTTPVPELVEELADRVALLKDGKILACDTPEGLRRLAACEGSLGEVFDQLVQGHTQENIRQYFQEMPK